LLTANGDVADSAPKEAADRSQLMDFNARTTGNAGGKSSSLGPRMRVSRGRSGGYLTGGRWSTDDMATPGYRTSGSSLRFRVAGRTAMLLAVLSFIAGTLVLVQALQDLVGFGYRGPAGFHPGLPLGLLAWVGGALLTGLLGYIGTRLHRRGRQLATPAGSVVDGPFVLYLHPFDADVALAEIART